MILFDEIHIAIGIRESDTLTADERKRLLRKLRRSGLRLLLDHTIKAALPEDIVPKLEVKISQ